MKWPLKPVPVKDGYPGDRRSLYKFAWLPIKTTDKFRVWLEYYESNEVYKNVAVWHDPHGVTYGWVVESRFSLAINKYR